jgi:hypothetical protein
MEDKLKELEDELAKVKSKYKSLQIASIINSIALLIVAIAVIINALG